MDDRLVAGIDVGGTKTAGVLLSARSQELLASAIDPTDRFGSPQRTAEKAEAMVDRLLQRAKRPRDSLTAVGVGLPGLIAPDRTFRESIILPTWRNVDFHSLLQARLGIPIVVDNDATMAALGHMASTPPRQRPSCLVCMTLGTGVGGAILIDGVPLRGPDGTAGQVGHIIVEPAGRCCDCGNLGCLNAYASGTAIAARYAELQRDSVTAINGEIATTAIEVHRALRAGDELARQAIDEAINALVIGISTIVNVLNPEVVVLGGGVANLGSTLVDPIQLAVSQHAFSAPAQRVRVCRSAHGALSGAVGAAVTAASLREPNPHGHPSDPSAATYGDTNDHRPS